MIFFGNPIYRLVSGVISIATILIVYFVIIKPNVHTVSKAINQGLSTFRTTQAPSTPSSSEKLAHCLIRANGNLHKVQRCEARFQP